MWLEMDISLKCQSSYMNRTGATIKVHHSAPSSSLRGGFLRNTILTLMMGKSAHFLFLETRGSRCLRRSLNKGSVSVLQGESVGRRSIWVAVEIRQMPHYNHISGRFIAGPSSTTER
jgi:alkylated DNA repair dioxygenase AlkB